MTPTTTTVSNKPTAEEKAKAAKAAKAAKDRHLAEACFAAAGQDPYAKCPHGLTGYACMDCNH